jgi:voltage-gated potassium channel
MPEPAGPRPEEEAAAEAAQERWTTLAELEEWLRTPMLVLSVAWLALVVVELTWGENGLLETVGIVIWAIFLAEFLLRLWLAPDRVAFLRANWLSVIALVAPAFRLLRGLRVLRLARAARGLRLVRVVGTANRGMNALRAAMRRRGLGYLVALTALVDLLGAAGMYAFERAPEVEGGFAGFGDALWWTSMLLTTMGSAYWPVTAEGRVLCLLLSVYAFAVFGYITAAFASFFVGRDAEERGGAGGR